MRNYCTLFDSRYLPQGLALYDSLKKHSSVPFTLHVLTMDEKAWGTLFQLRLENVALYQLPFFEAQMNLRTIREERTWAEFCWTCSSQLCEWLMKSGVSEITYLDADCMVFSNPEVAFTEIGDRSIAIALHRLIPSKKHLEATSGRWNVGFMFFRDTPSGRACLQKWARQVRDRCSAETGGDQLYVEDFIKDHGDNVCSFENIGVNAAPWNIGNWKVTEGPWVDGVPVVTFHAHETRFNPDGTVFLTNYRLRDEDRKFIYRPYVEAVERARNLIESLHVQTG